MNNSPQRSPDGRRNLGNPSTKLVVVPHGTRLGPTRKVGHFRPKLLFEGGPERNVAVAPVNAPVPKPQSVLDDEESRMEEVPRDPTLLRLTKENAQLRKVKQIH